MDTILVGRTAGFSDRLRAAFDNTRAGSGVTAMADSFEAAAEIAQRGGRALLVFDFDALGVRAMKNVRQFLVRFPRIPIVALGASEDCPHYSELIAAGVLGYVSSATNPEVLAAHLQLVHESSRFEPERPLEDDHADGGTCAAIDVAQLTHDRAASQLTARLTQRQLSVAAQLAQGATNKEISRLLEISQSTVKAHVAAICELLQVTSRTRAALVLHDLEEVRRLRLQQAEEGKIDLAWLIQFAAERNLKAGEVVFRKGEPANEMFYISRGRVSIPEIGFSMGVGEIFGEIGLFMPDRARTLTVAAEEETQVYAISQASVNRLYFQNPQFAFLILRMVAQRLDADRKRPNASQAG